MGTVSIRWVRRPLQVDNKTRQMRNPGIRSIVETAFSKSVSICVNLRINCIPDPCGVDIGPDREFVRKFIVAVE